MARMPKCDCLNWCGDDSRVPNGKAKPCQRWLREQAEAEERWSMEEDAARYRWLRHNSGYTIRCDLFGEVGPHEHKDGDLDALIDAQMVPDAEVTGGPRHVRLTAVLGAKSRRWRDGKRKDKSE